MSTDTGSHAGTSRAWGVWLHAVRSVPELVELAVRAEERGAAALLLADEGVDRDLYVTLTAVGIATRHLALFPAITNPHSRHPVATAAALGSLAEVAPGRVVAGLGAGGSLVFGPMGLAPGRPFTALVEAIDVVEELLDGKTVTHHGEFATRDARLEWARGRLPLAVAGRGPRVQRLSAERADWVIVSGKPVHQLPDYLAGLRRDAAAAGRSLRVAWNPMVGWQPEHVTAIRSHLSYMSVDMPEAWRHQHGVDDDVRARLRDALRVDGPDGAGPLVPQGVVDAFAIVGDREDVGRRLAAVVTGAAADIVVFGAHDYTVEHVDELADLATEVGLHHATGPVPL